jgi:DNA-binding SARP family transcriptional activator
MGACRCRAVTRVESAMVELRMSLDRPTLDLTGGFRLGVAGEPVVIGHSSARLLAYLALAGHPVVRSLAAAQLWPDSSPSRAATNLRTALWRIPVPCDGLVVRRGPELAIDPMVRIDVTELLASASAAAEPPVDVTAVRRLGRLTDLLPGWNDGWVLAERERLRLVSLDALEAAASASARSGLPAQSLELASAALRADPLRETAWRLVVAAHRDLGNLAAAVRAYQSYRTLLHRELGIGPSVLMQRLIAPLIAECGAVRAAGAG